MKTPCLGDDRFTSEHMDEREEAAYLCRTCPIKAKCLAGAKERGEEHYVWGGEDFTPGTQRKTPRQPCSVCGTLMPRTMGRQRSSCVGCIEKKPCGWCGHDFPRTYHNGKAWAAAKYCGHRCSRAAQKAALKAGAAA